MSLRLKLYDTVQILSSPFYLPNGGDLVLEVMVREVVPSI